MSLWEKNQTEFTDEILCEGVDDLNPFAKSIDINDMTILSEHFRQESRFQSDMFLSVPEEDQEPSSEIDFEESLLGPSQGDWLFDYTLNESSAGQVFEGDVNLNKVVDDIFRINEIKSKKALEIKNQKMKRKAKINSNESTQNSSTSEGSHVLRKPIRKRLPKPERLWISAKRTKRWGKAEDKLMFDLLQVSIREHGVDITELSMPESLLLESNHYEILLNLKREMGWVGTTRQILQRIWILKENTKLSVRDERHVRKLANDQMEANKVDIDAIVYNFPCKDVEAIKTIWDKIFSKSK